MLENHLSIDDILQKVKNGELSAEDGLTALIAIQTHRDAADDASDGMLYFENKWESCGRAESTRPVGGKNILLFCDDHAVFQSVKTWQGNEGGAVFVKEAENYRRLSSSEYEICKTNGGDYTELLRDLIDHKFIPDSIAVLWPINRAAGRFGAELFKNSTAINPEYVKSCADDGINTVFYIIKALYSLKIKTSIDLTLFFPMRSGFAANPYMEAAGGFCKSLGFIMPNLYFSTVGVEEEYNDSDNRLCSALIEELSVPDYLKFNEVRYYGGERFKRVLRKTDVPKIRNEMIKDGGTYLITGGMGALGVLFSKRMALDYKVNLALVGRSPLDAKKKAVLDILKGMGSQAIYIQADCCDLAEMERAVAKTKKSFGAINGALHLAGGIDAKLVVQKSIAEFQKALDAKVKGIVALDVATRGERLDFIADFSSVSAFMGDFGQCDYAVGNRFLDSYMELRDELVQNGLRSGVSVSIDWPLWKEGGMHMPGGGEKMYMQSSGLNYLTMNEGADVFYRAVCSGHRHIAAFSGDEAKITGFVNSPKIPKVSAAVNAETLDSAKKICIAKDVIDYGGNLIQAVGRDIACLISDMLKIKPEKIDPEDNFGDYGFDSVSLKTFAESIGEKYQIDISPAAFFANSTLKKLAKYLTEEYEGEVSKYYGTALKEKPTVMPLPDNRILEPVTCFENGSKTQVSNGTVKLTDVNGLFEKSGLQAELVQETADPENELLSGVSVGKNKPIAIIGAAGIFPQSRDIEEFWNRLANAENLVKEIPLERWDWRKYYSSDPFEKNKTVSKWGGFIDDVDKFDAGFFNISRREAEFMDPQQRLFLVSVFNAIEDAGYKVSQLSQAAGNSVGVFAATEFSDYQHMLDESVEVQPQIATGNANAMLSNRVSYMYDFNGPSETIDTACSGSLVAVHRAVKAIQAGECGLAVAGGVSLMLSADMFLTVSKLGVLSPDGKCKTLDKSANGYVKGEGVGAVLLKPLKDAVADHDHIYAVIKGSAENHGGNANSLTAPNSKAQADVIVKACTEAGFDSDSISYVELHGTGTELGDPVEVEGLKIAFKRLKKSGRNHENYNFCGIGSVKTNIGHLEPASGIAGLIKIILAMEHETLPASLHFKELNPYISLEKTPFYIVTKSQKWERLKDSGGKIIPRRAGVSSFGFGGTNAHVALEEYVPQAKSNDYRAIGDYIVVLSAKNEDSLRAYARRLEIFVRNHMHRQELMADLAYTLQVGREEMNYRLAVIAGNANELAEKLNAYRHCESGVDGLFCGCVKENKFVTGSDENGIIHADADKKRSIAEIWANGGKIDWAYLYKDCPPYRISLPTYPFVQNRYWIPRPSGTKPPKRESAPHNVLSIEELLRRVENGELDEFEADRLMEEHRYE